jgi:hypothetical protein
MDPRLIKLALDLLMRNPDLLHSARPDPAKTAASRTIDMAKMESSFADLSAGVLHCYHETATFHEADVVQQPWTRQAQYAADTSTVVRIRYFGLSNRPHEMLVAVMGKQDQMRTAVVSDTATIRYDRRCKLENWTGK